MNSIRILEGGYHLTIRFLRKGGLGEYALTSGKEEVGNPLLRRWVYG